jgi:hypothetical protein
MRPQRWRTQARTQARRVFEPQETFKIRYEVNVTGTQAIHLSNVTRAVEKLADWLKGAIKPKIKMTLKKPENKLTPHK